MKPRCSTKIPKIHTFNFTYLKLKTGRLWPEHNTRVNASCHRTRTRPTLPRIGSELKAWRCLSWPIRKEERCGQWIDSLNPALRLTPLDDVFKWGRESCPVFHRSVHRPRLSQTLTVPPLDLMWIAWLYNLTFMGAPLFSSEWTIATAGSCTSFKKSKFTVRV